MTNDDPKPDTTASAPVTPEAERRATGRGFSLGSLMLVVTLVSLICGLSVVAPGLGIAAAMISLPAFARTTIVLRHAVPTAAAGLAAKLAAFGTSCCVAVVVAIAAGALGFGACWVTGYPSAFIGGALLSPIWPSGGDDYAPMMVSAFGVGILSGCAAAVFIAYRLFLRPAWFPVPKQELSRSERRFLLGMLVLTALGTSAGAFVLFVWSW